MRTEESMKNCKNGLIWFRNDLRLHDNPALDGAIKMKKPILATYIWSPGKNNHRNLGEGSRIWLHHALKDLEEGLKAFGVKLIIRKGNVLENLKMIIRESKVYTLFFNKNFEPKIVKEDAIIEKKLLALNIDVQSFCGNNLYEPYRIKNKQGNPYKVFTAFYKKVIQAETARRFVETPLSKIKPADVKISSLKVNDLNLIIESELAKRINKYWNPTEVSAKALLENFKRDLVKDYAENRNIPGIKGTSLLSPYLHFGQISPYQIFEALKNEKSLGSIIFKKELIWREFATNLLYHFPKTDKEPMREEFKKFGWKANKQYIEFWKEGKTGYPIVDAGMRELREKGWMHNRVRMIVGSFLVKHLMQPWQEGERYFWEILVDADLASNVMNWQWVGGCGADAAPFFRIFNPILQGKKFDPEGKYIKTYVPELKYCPVEFIHTPWKAKTEFKDYPKPIVDQYG